MSTYAPTEAQAQAVASYLSSMGYSNVIVDDNRLLVSADGTASTAAAAFNTSLSHFTRNGQSGIANVTDAQIPGALADVVLAVLGLQTVETMTTFAMPAAVGETGTGANVPPPSGSQGYDPTAFPLIYSANTLPAGSAANIGIISDGSQTITSTVLNDLKLFESNNSLPTLSPTVVAVGGSSSDSNSVVEWDLDSQTIQAMAGGSLASLTFYAAQSLLDSNIAAAISKAVSDDKAKIINASLGICETSAYNDGSMATDDQSFVSGLAQGQTFSVSTGDNGSRTCGASGNGTYGTSISVSYPASSPYVVAVGGTSLQTNSNGTWASETAWSYSGGGYSAYELPAQWTQGVTSVPSGDRGIPDVAMDADPNTGVYIALNGTYPSTQRWGGTSLASPLFVGAWARIQTAQNNKFGYPNPIMYAQAVPIAAFHDITSGNNDDYNAGSNWDFVTGWGSLITSTLSPNLAALPANGPTSVSDTNGGVACPSDFIQWSAVSGASSYKLFARERAPTPVILYSFDLSTSGTGARVTLSSGYTYAYSVEACTSDGCSPLSTSEVTVTYGTCP